jgi:DNA-binding transcriptional ArsR family regulator
MMDGEWSFLTNHARALVCIAHDEGLRLRDIAAVLGVTERTVFGIVTDLTEAGYVLKEKEGRRNRYRIQHHLPVRQAVGREPTIGELLELLVEPSATRAARLPDLEAATQTRRRGPGAQARSSTLG